MKFQFFEGSADSIHTQVNNFLESIRDKKVKIIQTNLSTTWVYINNDDKGMNVYYSILYEVEP